MILQEGEGAKLGTLHVWLGNDGVSHRFQVIGDWGPAAFLFWGPAYVQGLCSFREAKKFTWRIIPFSKWLVTPIYQPFRPFGMGITPFRGLTNHGY